MFTPRFRWIIAFLMAISLVPQPVACPQESSEKGVLIDGISALKSGGISDDRLSRIDGISQSDSPYRDFAKQAACFLRLQRGDYRSVWAAVSGLDSLPNAETNGLDWGYQRLKLWLSMEARRNEQAAELLKSAVKSSLGIEERSVGLGKIDAELLGVLVAISQADNSQDRISPEITAKAIELMSNHPRKSLAAAFTTTYQRTQAEVKDLAANLQEIQELTEAQLDAERSKLLSQKGDWERQAEEAKEGLALARQELRKVHGTTSKTEQSSRKLLYDLNNTEEPGRPSEPRPPKRPNVNSSRDERNDFKKEQERRIAEQKYQQNLVEYQRELATYPARLAEWNQRNEIRKKRLADAHLQAKENTVVLKKQEDELQQRVKDREEEVEKANREIKSIRSKLQSFDSLLAQRKEGDRFKGIYRPSLFQSVDWSAEADRLLKELR